MRFLTERTTNSKEVKRQFIWGLRIANRESQILEGTRIMYHHGAHHLGAVFQPQIKT